MNILHWWKNFWWSLILILWVQFILSKTSKKPTSNLPFFFFKKILLTVFNWEDEGVTQKKVHLWKFVIIIVSNIISVPMPSFLLFTGLYSAIHYASSLFLYKFILCLSLFPFIVMNIPPYLDIFKTVFIIQICYISKMWKSVLIKCEPKKYFRYSNG